MRSWGLRYRIHDVRLNLRRIRQRAFRGWAESDSYAIDYYLDTIIPPMVDRLRERNLGWPEGIVADETTWTQILSAIAEGFRAHRHLMDMDYFFEVPGEEGWRYDTAQEAAWQLAAKEGLALFVTYYEHLWD